MTRRPSRTIATLAVAFVVVAMSVIAWWTLREPPIEPNPMLPTAVYLVGSPPLVNELRLEVADDGEEMYRGLMARDAIGSADGMVFTDPSQPTGFWMRGVRFPLDIVYVGRDGRVLRVVRGKPFDETPLAAGGPTSLVIEVPAGGARFYGLKPGAQVRRMEKTR
jgi:uncharacterized membrane protein (UPF0127 family)